jgi:hypothetical protein
MSRHEILGARSIKTKNYPANRSYLLTTAVKMYCNEDVCETLRRVVDYFAGAKGNQVALDCGHRRNLGGAR